ncbi:heavy-metal-associated domain-containing protein [Kineothrix sedimenti]|uniref:Cation transporter n=1 Tax=Kineothrix sedimenti TaxID=3123317 RepID=A0ABZ3EZI5_9FIRM
MIGITIKIEGMQCGMCEAHLNDAVRGAFPVKKVTSSHGKGRMVILTEQDINEEKLKSVIENTGYQAVAVDKAPYEKKGIFSALRK